MVAVAGLVVLHPRRRLVVVVPVLLALAAMRQEPREVRQEPMVALLVQQVIQRTKQIWAAAQAPGA